MYAISEKFLIQLTSQSANQLLTPFTGQPVK